MNVCSRKGFGLIEVLAVGTIGAIVLMSISSMTLNAFKGARTVQSRNDFNTLVNDINLILQNQTQCAAFLKNIQGSVAKFNPDVQLATNTVFSEFRLAGLPLLKVGKPFDGFKISALSLLEVDASMRKTGPTPNTNQYLAKLHLEAIYTGKSFLGNQRPSNDFLLWLNVSTANDSTLNQIVSCGASVQASPVPGPPVTPPSGNSGGSLTNFQVFDTSGSFRVPPGITKIAVEAWGGGSGGSVMCSGAGGAYGKSLFTVTHGTVYPVTVGAGGAAGLTWGSASGHGGASSFGSLITSGGGGDGYGNVWPVIACGRGGTSNGQIAIRGGSGIENVEIGSADYPIYDPPQSGGDSPYGGLGAAKNVGEAGGIPGGGGAWGWNSGISWHWGKGPATAGGRGRVIVYW